MTRLFWTLFALITVGVIYFDWTKVVLLVVLASVFLFFGSAVVVAIVQSFQKKPPPPEFRSMKAAQERLAAQAAALATVDAETAADVGATDAELRELRRLAGLQQTTPLRHRRLTPEIWNAARDAGAALASRSVCQ